MCGYRPLVPAMASDGKQWQGRWQAVASQGPAMAVQQPMSMENNVNMAILWALHDCQAALAAADESDGASQL